MAIIEVLQEKSMPLSELEIMKGMGDLYDRITFYRSMQTITEAGPLHRVVIDNTNVKQSGV